MIRSFYIVVSFLSLLFGLMIVLENKLEAGKVWLSLDEADQESQATMFFAQGRSFNSKINFGTWEAEVGAYHLTLHFNPKDLRVLKFTNLKFPDNTFINEDLLKLGIIEIAGFQTESLSENIETGILAEIEWKTLRNINRLPNITLTAKAIIDSSWKPVDVFSFNNNSGLDSEKIRAELISPPPGTTLSSSEVIFEWTRGGDEILFYEIKISSSGNVFFDETVSGTSVTVTDVPLTGKDIFVSLVSKTGEDDFFKYFRYKTIND